MGSVEGGRDIIDWQTAERALSGLGEGFMRTIEGLKGPISVPTDTLRDVLGLLLGGSVIVMLVSGAVILGKRASK